MRTPSLIDSETETRHSGPASSHEAMAPGSQLSMMVLDKFGVIRYCSVFAARLFRASAQELIGRSIASLVPQLPLRQQTPGYNIAFATFWAAADSNPAYTAVDGQGGSIPIRISLEQLSLEGHHQILVNLSPISAPMRISAIALDDTPLLPLTRPSARLPVVAPH